MAKNIKGVFQDVSPDFIVDRKLLGRLKHTQLEFVNRNEAHIAFFGGNLFGVDKVRFLTSDRNNWFDNIIEIDDIELKMDLHALPSINSDFKVSSDVFNISCVWLCHKFMVSTLTDKEREEGMRNALLMFIYRVITSRLANDFSKFPNREDIAAATYAELSKKFSLKKYGSWGRLLTERANAVFAKNSIHYKTLNTFDNDKAILYIITDVQSRIRDIINKMWNVLKKVIDSDARMVTTLSTMETEDGLKLKDLNRELVSYNQYIETIIPLKISFIKSELIQVIGSMQHTMDIDKMTECLQEFSKRYLDKGYEEFHDFVNMVLVHCFDTIGRDKNFQRHGVALTTLLPLLRGMYTSSRSTDPMLLELRKVGDVVISKTTSLKTPAKVASVRTGLMLYLILRTFTKGHYSN